MISLIADLTHIVMMALFINNCKLIFCCLFIFQLISIGTSSPIDEASTFENMQNVLSNEQHADLNEQFLNVPNSNHEYTSICWAESIIITENKITKNNTTSKSYSILLDTPEKLKELHIESENASCLEILEHNAKPRKAMNFTTIKETNEYIIREHKTLFCGAGPVLSHHFIVWPKLNRRQIEISINPLSATKWRHCNEENDNDDSLVGNAMESEVTRNFDSEDTLPQPPLTEVGTPRTIGDSFEDDIPMKLGPMVGDEVANPVSPKVIKNYLLRRNVNCTKDFLGVCNEMKKKSNSVLGYSNSSEVVFGKWFFLDNTNIYVDQDRSFMLKVKIIINMANAGGDTEGTELVVEEDCLYVIPK